MIKSINEFKQYLKDADKYKINEKKYELQQDNHDKLKINLDEEIILKHAKKMFKNIKTIKDVFSLGSKDYDKLIKELHNIYSNKNINEGRGNTIIRYESSNWPTYYIEYYDSEDEDGNPIEDSNDYFYDDLKGNIEHFKSVNLTKLSQPKWISNDQAVYFEGSTIKVVFADNEWSVAVGVIPAYFDENEEGEEVIPEGFNEEASAFFNELNSLYKLYTATSAWTSSVISNDQPIVINENVAEHIKIVTANYYIGNAKIMGYIYESNPTQITILRSFEMTPKDSESYKIDNFSNIELATPGDFEYFRIQMAQYDRPEYIWNRQTTESVINENITLPEGMVKALDDIDERRPNRMKRPDAYGYGNDFAGRGGQRGLVYIQDEAERVMQDKYGRERGTKLWNASINAPQRGAMFKMADDVMKEKQYLADELQIPMRTYWDVSYYSLWKAWMAKQGLTYKIDSDEDVQANADAKRAAEEAAKQQALDAKKATEKAQFDRTLNQIESENTTAGLPSLQPDAKDKQRVADMFRRDSWPTTAANTMANAIKDVNKAVRRGQAVLDYVKDNNLSYFKLDIAKIFFNKAKSLLRNNEGVHFNDEPSVMIHTSSSKNEDYDASIPFEDEDLYHDIDWVDIESKFTQFASTYPEEQYASMRQTFNFLKEEILKYKMTN